MWKGAKPIVQHGLSALGELTQPHSNLYTGRQVTEGPSGVWAGLGAVPLWDLAKLLTTLKEKKSSFGGFSFSYHTQCVGFGDEDGNKGPNLKDALGQRFFKVWPWTSSISITENLIDVQVLRALPQTYWIRSSGGGAQQCVPGPCRWFWCIWEPLLTPALRLCSTPTKTRNCSVPSW